ncbi:hypothetical protein KIW84_014794 [Lathyrus oleraceus]|uniref:Uncharacterized protein n=1 Tax=Pisum sativum TaxID=3888 RepID=A0A9D5GZR3_PEA|nr:hypothetical protein KIW84_014794 [Pisum sativum]
MKIHQLTLSNTKHEDTIEEVHITQCLRLVNRWGYKEGSYRLWTKFLDIDEDLFHIRKDDDAYNFAAYDCATKVDGDIHLEHDVTNLELKAQKEIDDGDENYSDELDNSDPDESDDGEGPKFESFRKKQLSKDYNFKWDHKHTYAIKTLVDTHTCARVLNNRSSNSKWVAKAVLKKMQTFETVRIREIMQDMRQNFSVGISVLLRHRRQS